MDSLKYLGFQKEGRIRIKGKMALLKQFYIRRLTLIIMFIIFNNNN